MGLLATLRLWLAGFTAQGVRARHERLAEEARERAAREGRLYDVYPEHQRRSSYWLTVQTRGPRGQFLSERVRLKWPLELTDLSTRGGQKRLINGVNEAYLRLRARAEPDDG